MNSAATWMEPESPPLEPGPPPAPQRPSPLSPLFSAELRDQFVRFLNPDRRVPLLELCLGGDALAEDFARQGVHVLEARLPGGLETGGYSANAGHGVRLALSDEFRAAWPLSGARVLALHLEQESPSPERARGALHFTELEEERLPLPDSSVSSIVCFHFFALGARQQHWWEELCRVLRPGGSLALVVASSPLTPERLRALAGVSPESHSMLEPPECGLILSEHCLCQVQLEALARQHGLQRVRTLELLDGLFLAFRAWR